jgi:hypothetical protein
VAARTHGALREIHAAEDAARAGHEMMAVQAETDAHGVVLSSFTPTSRIRSSSAGEQPESPKTKSL